MSDVRLNPFLLIHWHHEFTRSTPQRATCEGLYGPSVLRRSAHLRRTFTSYMQVARFQPAFSYACTAFCLVSFHGQYHFALALVLHGIKLPA